MHTNNLPESFPLLLDPHMEAEMMHITEYFKNKGYSAEKLAELSEEEVKVLREEASLYASLRLAELEMGAAFVNTFHHDATIAPVSVAGLSTVNQSEA